MKTRLIFAALAIAAMASCTVESLDTKVFHATLGGGDTRTSLQQDGSVAHVLWEAGDAITVFALLPNGAFYHNDFTTSDSGTASADFACHSWNPNNSNIEGYYGQISFMSIYSDIKNNADFRLVLSGYTNTGANDRFRLFKYDKDKVFLSYASLAAQNGYSLEGVSYIRMRYYTDAITWNNAQLEYRPTSDTTPTTYAPYVAPTTHTAQLGRTIYGGTPDVVNGTGTDNCKKITLGDFTWIKSGTEGNFYCSQVTDIWYPSEGGISRYGIGVSDEFDFVQGTPADGQINAYFNTAYSGYRIFIKKADYADRTSAEFREYLQSINAHLVYKVNDATAEDFTFTPVPIISRLGDNTLWGNGDLSVVYRSSGTQTLIPPTLISKTITANGTYTASDDGADGYDEVTVNVPTGTTEPFKVLSISGTAGSETFTADKAGTYMFLVGTSAQGTASITSAVTPDLTFSKQSSDNRGLVGAIFTLGVGDTVTMSNSVVSWVYNTKVVIKMNISVSAVIDSTIVNDGTITCKTIAGISTEESI